MAKDVNGVDIDKIFRPMTGTIWYADIGVDLPVNADITDVDFQPDSDDYTALGLVASDGGPAWTLEADGDPEEFWQSGYSVPSGLSTANVTTSFAEINEDIVSLQTGSISVDGYSVIDAAGSGKRYRVFYKEISSNLIVRFRWGTASATVVESQSERGAVTTYEVTFTFDFDTTIGGHVAQKIFYPAPE